MTDSSECGICLTIFSPVMREDTCHSSWLWRVKKIFKVLVNYKHGFTGITCIELTIATTNISRW
jgi:hypothetical protein